MSISFGSFKSPARTKLLIVSIVVMTQCHLLRGGGGERSSGGGEAYLKVDGAVDTREALVSAVIPKKASIAFTMKKVWCCSVWWRNKG